jgi:phosphotransferase system enzyme I (PtsI)
MQNFNAEEVILKGYPICRGIAIGKPFFLNRDEYKIFEWNISSADKTREIARYRSALSRSKQDIKRLQKQLEAESALEGIVILDAQIEMLQDPLLTKEIEKEIRKTNKNVEFVFQKAVQQLQEKFNASGDSFFAERFKDLQDLARRILSYLQESNSPISLSQVPLYAIVCASELTATDMAEAQSNHVGAFITENGGVTSHAAIVAKAKGIPYITRIPLQILKENRDQLMIMDGRTGLVIINPLDITLKRYELLKEQIQSHVQNLEKLIRWPAETFDGYSIRLSANLEMSHEIDLIHQFGGEGIGLFRSEYIFLPKNEIPSEEEQFHIYSNVVTKMKGLPIVIRTFDLGGDKPSLPYKLASEKQNFLNCRATRWLLKEKNLFKTQLRAILRASLHGNISILFPMISTLSELRQAKKMLVEAQQELGIEKTVRIGCMIEVPSAALIVDHFAKECDFLSIGTNDLVQYSLAVDRGDHYLSEFYEPNDPSVIRLIKLITSEANQAKVPVAVCGEIASDPRFTPLLLGLGIQELSVTPRCLPLIKNTIRHTSIVDAVQLAEKALSLTTAQEVMQLLKTEYQKTAAQDLFYIEE